MVNCGKCGRKIGFWSKSHAASLDEVICESCYSDTLLKNKSTSYNKLNPEEKERLVYCLSLNLLSENISNKPPIPKKYDPNSCFICQKYPTKWFKGLKICLRCSNLIDSEEGKSILKKKKKEEFIQRDKSAPLVSNYCKKYLQDKDFDFKGIILGINKDMLYLIKKNSLDGLEEYFSDLYQQAQERTPSSSHDYDEIMDTELSCNNGFQLIEDIIKLKKLMDKKDIQTNYIQIFKEMINIVKKDIMQLLNKLTIPAYKRISKITTTDKKLIIKEYLKLGFDEPNVMIISDLLDKFNLKCNDSEVEKLLGECIEEQELDEFEENLGVKKIKNIGDFNKLNGHQFEDYLKDLFTILGYQVIRTKLSGDQGADLIIKKDNQKTVVQAKKYSGSVTNKAIQEVVASKKHYRADKGMVVTTGKFTKSAMELAKSNKVDLWDKNKLNEIISNINSKSKKKVLNTQSADRVDNYFPLSCPFCESQIKISIEDVPLRGKTGEVICPECEMNLVMSPKEETYICIGCKKVYDDIKTKMKHTKQCDKIKEKSFKCTSCKKEFTLDDSEFEELEKKGKLNIECPACNKNNLIKR